MKRFGFKIELIPSGTMSFDDTDDQVIIHQCQEFHNRNSTRLFSRFVPKQDRD